MVKIPAANTICDIYFKDKSIGDAEIPAFRENWGLSVGHPIRKGDFYYITIWNGGAEERVQRNSALRLVRQKLSVITKRWTQFRAKTGYSQGDSGRC